MNQQHQVDRFAELRQRMVDGQLRSRDIHDERVLAAMLEVPRHEFIGEHLQDRAYADCPVEIGEGQTVSQPYIVARMLQALEIDPEDKVLEIGTGTGYQAALLAKLAREVFTIERHSALAQAARNNLRRLGVQNVSVWEGDGSRGLPAHTPFGRIIVAAAAPEIPPALIDQLAENGKMVAPVGARDVQVLKLISRRGAEIFERDLDPCRFVPLVGSGGWDV